MMDELRKFTRALKEMESIFKLNKQKLDEMKKKLAELEQEKSAAEEWSDSQPSVLKGDFSETIRIERIIGHEAGQAHANAETHEIYKPLVKIAKIIRNKYASATLANQEKFTFKDWSQLNDTLKNLNHQPQEEEPEIIGELESRSVSYSDEDRMVFILNVSDSQQKFTFLSTPVGQKYKLIPIED